MTAKTRKMTKPEMIQMFLETWDPAFQEDRAMYDYSESASEIAAKVRSNSRLETVENAVKEEAEKAMKNAGIEEPMDENLLKACSYMIWAAARK